MTEIKVDAPKSYTESIPNVLTEQEAYAKSREINKSKDHHAVVESGKLKVSQVLRG